MHGEVFLRVDAGTRGSQSNMFWLSDVCSRDGALWNRIAINLLLSLCLLSENCFLAGALLTDRWSWHSSSVFKFKAGSLNDNVTENAPTIKNSNYRDRISNMRMLHLSQASSS